MSKNKNMFGRAGAALSALRPQIGQVWRLSLPAILTQITTIAMQYIDSAMVGNLGANASASIGLVASTTWLLSGLTYAVSAGFSVQVAHRIGAGRDDEARAVLRHALVSALVVSGILAAIGLAICRPLPGWLGGDAELLADSTAYFAAFAVMIPFSQLNSLSSSCLQCSGDMVTPSILNAVMCGLDVLFNAIFIPHFGVAGAGMGTTAACMVVSLIMLWCCCVKNERLRLWGDHRGNGRGCGRGFEPAIIKRAFKIGLPFAVQEIAMNSAMVAATTLIAPLGPVSIAANSFAVTAESLCYMPGYGIGSAATTLVGRSVGAGDAKQARRFGNISVAMGGIFMGITGALMMLACPLVFMFLTKDPAVRSLAAEVLRMELFAEPLFGISIVAAGALRGAGDTLLPSIMSLSSIWVVRIGMASILVPRMGLYGMWIAMTVELCVRGFLLLARQLTSHHYERAAAQNAAE